MLFLSLILDIFPIVESGNEVINLSFMDSMMFLPSLPRMVRVLVQKMSG